MYQNCYDIIMQYIFNGVEITAHIDLVATLLATLLTIGAVAIPVCVVWAFIRAVTSCWRA